MKQHDRIAMAALMAVAALGASGEYRPRVVIDTGDGRPPRPPPSPERLAEMAADRDRAEWNAAVEQRKAEKRARKAARSAP